MRLLSFSALVAMVFCLPSLGHADSCSTGQPGCVTIYNYDGTFVSNSAQTSLSMGYSSTASQLYGVVGLGSGYDCSGLSGGGSCSGTIKLQTGNIIAGGSSTSLFPLTGQSTWLGGGTGTSFDVTENAKNGLNGFTFQGTFSSVAGANAWSCLVSCTANYNKKHQLVSYTGTWALTASIVNAVLTIGGQQYDIAGASSVQLSSLNGTVTYANGKPVSFIDGSGTSEFPSPVPEPGTLSLFGGGLIVVGFITRRRLNSRSSAV